MAKKNKKIEKNTRRLIEGISDLVKFKGGQYKFKTKKKKVIRQIKEKCVHWDIDKKGNGIPTVAADPNNPNNWKCKICQASFPIRPLTKDEYTSAINRTLGIVNHLQFLGVKMGGDEGDTRVFLRLKTLLPRLNKIQKGLIKSVNKRQEWETRSDRKGVSSQFSTGYTGYDYR